LPPATQPTPRDDNRHKGFLEIAGRGNIDLLFVGDKFLTADGTLTTEIMADGLHPTAKGYEIWAAAIIDTVKRLMNS
jgi:lysophospholipase L1-like esterase